MTPARIRLDPVTGHDRAPLVGVIHLPPLSGPEAPSVAATLQRAEADARAYAQAGFDAVVVENFGDAPFPRSASEPHVVAAMTRVATAVRAATGLVLGVNVLRNDARAALAVCHAAGGRFVRVNVHTGATVTDQGLIEGDAHGTIGYRHRLGAGGSDGVLVCADVDVKHGASLVQRPLEDLARETAYRGKADVLLVTGPQTGRAVAVEDLQRVTDAVPDRPAWAASGVTAETVGDILLACHGVIVGSAVKQDGVTTAPVDPARAAAFVAAADKVRRGR